MALKAGRVGVAPSEVDEFGQIIGEITPTNVYTKTQADEKFETQTNANTERAKLQPKTLSVPISMLEGSQLVPKTTVEAVIQTMNNAMTNEELTEKVSTSSRLTDRKESITLPSSSTTSSIAKITLEKGKKYIITANIQWGEVANNVPTCAFLVQTPINQPDTRVTLGCYASADGMITNSGISLSAVYSNDSYASDIHLRAYQTSGSDKMISWIELSALEVI